MALLEWRRRLGRRCDARVDRIAPIEADDVARAQRGVRHPHVEARLREHEVAAVARQGELRHVVLHDLRRVLPGGVVEAAARPLTRTFHRALSTTEEATIALNVIDDSASFRVLSLHTAGVPLQSQDALNGFTVCVLLIINEMPDTF